MLAIISPAKKLLEEYVPRETLKTTQPQFTQEIDSLVDELKSYSKSDVSDLMKLSDKLSELNHSRYQNYEALDSIPAAFCFRGDVYTGLDIDTIPENTLGGVNSHLAILSGLYGLLRPFDNMKPYRLEMGTSLKIGNYKNLYEFWGDKITNAINERTSEVGASNVINLASGEYFKAVKPKLLNKPLITVDFKENKDGNFKTIGIHAKRARGLFARYIIDNDLNNPADLKSFNTDGYEFNKSLSEPEKLVFTR